MTHHFNWASCTNTLVSSFGFWLRQVVFVRVSLLVRQQDYTKTTKRISTKGPLTFSADPDKETDEGISSQCPSTCCLGSGLLLSLCLYLLAATGLTSSVRPPASFSKDFTFTLSLVWFSESFCFQNRPRDGSFWSSDPTEDADSGSNTPSVHVKVNPALRRRCIDSAPGQKCILLTTLTESWWSAEGRTGLCWWSAACCRTVTTGWGSAGPGRCWLSGSWFCWHSAAWDTKEDKTASVIYLYLFYYLALYLRAPHKQR